MSLDGLDNEIAHQVSSIQETFAKKSDLIKEIDKKSSQKA
jgi:hypothetical protein